MPLDILCFLGGREEMAHSLEARLPFLDHKLFDLAENDPGRLQDAPRSREGCPARRSEGYFARGYSPPPKKRMVPSEAVDLLGSDRAAAKKFDFYLTKAAFESAGIFSFRAYGVAHLPGARAASEGAEAEAAEAKCEQAYHANDASEHASPYVCRTPTLGGSGPPLAISLFGGLLLQATQRRCFGSYGKGFAEREASDPPLHQIGTALGVKVT